MLWVVIDLANLQSANIRLEQMETDGNRKHKMTLKSRLEARCQHKLHHCASTGLVQNDSLR